MNSTTPLSYTAQVKREILAQKQWRTTYKKQLVCGLMHFAQQYGPAKISLTTKEEQVARYYADLVPRLVPLQGSITLLAAETVNQVTYTVQVDEQSDRINLLNYFAMLYPEGVTFDLLGGENGTAAFLAGAFLACGSIADPEKNYHLEFAPANHSSFSQLCDMLTEVGFAPRLTERRGQKLIYFHDSQQIEDMLAFLGCSRMALEIMGVKIVKERRNVANSLSNCDTANIDKTISAATQQITAITKILEQKGEDYLSEDLLQLAKIRLQSPELSLRELGEALNPPLSRSGVNHRLQRLLKMAEEL